MSYGFIQARLVINKRKTINLKKSRYESYTFYLLTFSYVTSTFQKKKKMKELLNRFCRDSLCRDH